MFDGPRAAGGLPQCGSSAKLYAGGGELGGPIECPRHSQGSMPAMTPCRADRSRFQTNTAVGPDLHCSADSPR